MMLTNIMWKVNEIWMEKGKKIGMVMAAAT